MATTDFSYGTTFWGMLVKRGAASAAARKALANFLGRFRTVPAAERLKAINTSLARVKAKQPTVYKLIKEPMEEALAKHHGVAGAIPAGASSAKTLTGLPQQAADVAQEVVPGVKKVTRKYPARSVLSGAKAAPDRAYHIGELPDAARGTRKYV